MFRRKLVRVNLLDNRAHELLKVMPPPDITKQETKNLIDPVFCCDCQLYAEHEECSAVVRVLQTPIGWEKVIGDSLSLNKFNNCPYYRCDGQPEPKPETSVKMNNHTWLSYKPSARQIELANAAREGENEDN